MTKYVGTLMWMAPEVMLGQPYDFSADMYSYGMVLYEIASRRLPFPGFNRHQVR
jgi:serine/threonine protein kinase